MLDLLMLRNFLLEKKKTKEPENFTDKKKILPGVSKGFSLFIIGFAIFIQAYIIHLGIECTQGMESKLGRALWIVGYQICGVFYLAYYFIFRYMLGRSCFK
jgi:hypothetical protein